MTHTPGPWVARRALKPADGEYDYGIGAVIDGRERCIAETFGRVDKDIRPDAWANACLIAAAPTMVAPPRSDGRAGRETGGAAVSAGVRDAF